MFNDFMYGFRVARNESKRNRPILVKEVRPVFRPKVVTRKVKGIPVSYEENIDQVKFGMFVQLMLDKYGDRLMKCIGEIQNGETKYSVVVRGRSETIAINVEARREY